MRYYFDECLPYRIVDALAILDEKSDVQHQRKKFPRKPSDPPISDIEWIGDLSNEGNWVVVTSDKVWRIPEQKKALLASGLVAVFLSEGWGNLPFWDQAYKLFQRWERIKEKAEKASSGDYFRVTPRRMEIEQFKL